MEAEHIKTAAFFISSAAAYLGGTIAQTSIEDANLSKWIERGGTTLSIVFLLFGLRYLRGKLEDREKRLDQLHDDTITSNNKATEARMLLATALEKLSDRIDKR